MTPQEVLDAYAAQDPFDGDAGKVTRGQAAPALFDGVRDVLLICDAHERGATRWENPLPVPSWIAEVRAAISSALEAS